MASRLTRQQKTGLPAQQRTARIILYFPRGDIRLYYADKMDVALLPRISGCWMRLGQQRQVDTPGQNQTRYVFGAVNVVTGELYWVLWERNNNVGFGQLLRAILAAHADDYRKVVMVLDRSAYRIHKAKAVGELVRNGRQTHERATGSESRLRASQGWLRPQPGGWSFAAGATG